MGTIRETIDFDTHPAFELGDTHLTVRQLAAVMGISRKALYRRMKQWPLRRLRAVRIGGRPGRPIAYEYTPALHAYIQQHAVEPAPVEPHV